MLPHFTLNMASTCRGGRLSAGMEPGLSVRYSQSECVALHIYPKNINKMLLFLMAIS